MKAYVLHGLGLTCWIDSNAALQSMPLRILHQCYFCMQPCVLRVHTQCDILLLATSAAFTFAGLKCMCLKAHTQRPEQDGSQNFQECTSLSAWKQHWSILRVHSSQSPEMRLKSGESKNQIKRVESSTLQTWFLIQTRVAVSAISAHARAEEETPTLAVGWVWTLSVPVAAIPLPQHVSIATDPLGLIQQCQDLPTLLRS